MVPRIVFHLDMDAFFASVEVLGNPSLRGKPLVVGGFPGDRGVVSTASYEARRFGVHSGMPLREAERLCPQAIFIPCHPSPYVWFSTRILKLLLSRTPRVELFSIDEAFIEGEDLCRDRSAALAWARKVAGEIEERFGLTGSFGIGPNKLVAKMASKLDKPKGITYLTPPEFREVFWPKPVRALFGVGEKTAQALTRLGFVTVGELARADAEPLKRSFGVLGPALVAAAYGIDQSPVVPYGEGPPAKSIGHEHTFARDVLDRAEVDRLLLYLSDRVGRALRLEERQARTIHLKIRWGDFTTLLRQTSLEEAVDSSADLLRHARGLFRRFDLGGSVRLLGLSVSNLTIAGDMGADSLFPQVARVRAMDLAADGIRGRFGFDSLVRLGTIDPS